MSDHRLQVVETIGPTIKIVELSGPGPIGAGTGGPDNHLCGTCGNVLIANVRPGQIPSTFIDHILQLVIRCGRCHSTNAVPDVTSTPAAAPPYRETRPFLRA
jgi:ribosomal protein S27AE